MNLTHALQRLTDRFVATHTVSGRRFMYVGSHTIPASVVLGEGIGLEISASLYEIINGLLVPICLPYSMYEDDYTLQSSDTVFPAVFNDIQSILDTATNENRIGILRLPLHSVEAFEVIREAAVDFMVLSENHFEDYAEYMLVCHNFNPVPDGEATPFYSLHYDPDTEICVWVLAKKWSL